MNAWHVSADGLATLCGQRSTRAVVAAEWEMVDGPVCGRCEVVRRTGQDRPPVPTPPPVAAPLVTPIAAPVPEVVEVVPAGWLIATPDTVLAGVGDLQAQGELFARRAERCGLVVVAEGIEARGEVSGHQVVVRREHDGRWALDVDGEVRHRPMKRIFDLVGQLEGAAEAAAG